MDVIIRPNPKAAAVKIENYYICYRNRQLFKLLKLTISAAELSLTSDLLRKISPMESDFFRNERFLKLKIKFRFGGTEFPPGVYYKLFNNSTIFAQNNQKLFPENSGLTSSGNVMLNFPNKYSGYIDELPAKYGGKNNPWKKLDQSILLRKCFIHNIIDFVDSQKVPLILKSLMYQELQLDELNLSVATAIDQKNNSCNGRSVPKSHKQSAKSSKIKKFNWKPPNCDTIPYVESKAGDNLDSSRTYLNDGANLVAFSLNDIDWEDDALVLYEWTRNLSNAHV